MENNNIEHYQNMVKSYFNIVREYEELISKNDKEKNKLFVENMKLRYRNDCYNDNIVKHIKNKLKNFTGNDIKDVNVGIDKILIVDDNVRILLDESVGFKFFIIYNSNCIYEDNNGYITDKSNETELSDKAIFYYDNRNELINILREYMIYSEKF